MLRNLPQARTKTMGNGNANAIVRAAIFPSIGIARTEGKEGYLLAPEVPDPLPEAALSRRKGR